MTESESVRLPRPPSDRARPSYRHYAAVMWALTVLFFLRVAGQAVQRWAPRAWLPEFDRFQGSSLGYGVLLGSQLVILWVMAGLSFRMGAGRVTPARRRGVIIAWLGGVYMALALARLAVGLLLPGAPGWFTAWIPGAFHVVLATFVLALGVYHLSAVPSDRAR